MLRDARRLWMQWRRNRRGVVAVLYALMVIPLLGFIGLAVDFGIWNQTHAALARAANVAALNAVKIAANGQLTGDPNFNAEGVAAGKQWFAAQIGSTAYGGTTGTPVVTITPGALVSAQVAVTVTIPAMFGKLFGVTQYPVSIAATAVAPTSPYLDVEILLDNSSSMQIGASDADMLELEQLTPCAFSDETTNAVIQDTYAGYSCSDQTAYNGDLACPIATPTLTGGRKYTYPTFKPASLWWTNPPGPTCQGVLPANTDGTYPTAGSPCAFACHSDSTKPAGSGHDFYAVARGTIGVSGVRPVVLRFDLVKAATNTVISTMQADNLTFNNLRVGVFDFNLLLHADYPSTGTVTGNTLLGLANEAGSSWSSAMAAVGAPPTTTNGPDTGIQPDSLSIPGATHADTDLNGALVKLSTALAPAGDGSTPATPRKVLFLITDGFHDNIDGNHGPLNVADCQLFKTMGYTIYVVYTTYYPLMHIAWLDSYVFAASGPPSLSDNLKLCASSSDDYIEATDQAGLTAALQTFLQSALLAPARFTQ